LLDSNAEGIMLETTSTTYQAVSVDSDGVWHITGYPEARELLTMNVTQAGFQAEDTLKTGIEFVRVVLLLDGEEHRQKRRQVAKFFTPNRISHDYQPLIDKVADEVIADFTAKRQADLTDLTVRMASDVVCHIVGLTSSARPGIIPRMQAFLRSGQGKPSINPLEMARFLRGIFRLLNFYYSDVVPAIRARRKQPTDDVISHKLAQGATNMDIMTECSMYGGAGIITTQEFLCVAVKEILPRPELRAIMTSDDQDARYRLMNELLRVYPVVTKLIRRAGEDLTIQSDGQTVTIPAGSLIEFNSAAINTDPRVFGEDSKTVNPNRASKSEIIWSGLAFGHGAHRCVGEFLALAESDAFLRRFLALDGLRIDRMPTMTLNEFTTTYQFRDFQVSLA
jgi:cytochrome P450